MSEPLYFEFPERGELIVVACGRIMPFPLRQADTIRSRDHEALGWPFAAYVPGTTDDAVLLELAESNASFAAVVASLEPVPTEVRRVYVGPLWSAVGVSTGPATVRLEADRATIALADITDGLAALEIHVHGDDTGAASVRVVATTQAVAQAVYDRVAPTIARYAAQCLDINVE